MHEPVDHVRGDDAVLAAYRARMAAAVPADLDLAMRTVDRLRPPNWTLEWRLPVWLGRAFGVDGRIIEELVEANVLGLVAIRLLDDYDDGDLAWADRATAPRVASAAYDAALETYRARFPPTSSLWPFIDRTMTAWRRASARGRRATAARGAPLGIPAFALRLAADGEPVGREAGSGRWPRLARCLDAGLLALVLYDQFVDWESDLRAGRWNAFVAVACPGRQSRANRDRNHAAVLGAMLTRPVVHEHFARVGRAAREASERAADLGIEPLARHFSAYEATAVAQAAGIAAQLEAAAARAAWLLSGATTR